MNKRSRYILSVMIVMLALVTVVAGTYAFFAARVTGEDASTSVYVVAASEGIEITFTGGEKETLVNIYPRTAPWLEKDITITSTAVSSDIKSIYTFNMVVDKNTYHPDDIKYSFTKKTLNGVEEGATETSTLTRLENKIDIAHGLVKGTNAATITYTLRVYFVNDPTRNQNTGTNLDAQFYITYNWGIPVNLTVDLVGGTSNITNTSVAENSVLTLPSPTKGGYVFTGWTATGATVSGNTLTMGNTDATITATYREAANFESDSWATIASHVKNGTAEERYADDIGVTRPVTLVSSDANLNGKTFNVRFANNSNYNCTLESKTACGFVVEFEDIITYHDMNPPLEMEFSDGTKYYYGTNEGGWPATSMRTYVNNDIYNALPQEIREVIIKTDVVSGHGNVDSNTSRTDGNWTSQDKLYLLSTREVWENCTGGTNDSAGCYDSASLDTITRQLDYYANKGVTTSNYSGAIKKLNNTATVWWLRSATSISEFSLVGEIGDNMSNVGQAHVNGGVAPAFRIG